jgi:hypothetical protein
MKRDLWNAIVSDKECPPWPCPSCAKGVLLLDKKTFKYYETERSKASHSHEAFDADWVVYRFVAWCTCASCKDKVAISGRGGVEPYQDYDTGDYGYQNEFKTLTWNPMPDVFDLPAKCPDDVAQALRESFALHAFQPPASAGRLRVALELLMDAEKVPRETTNAKGKKSELTLHARLDIYMKTFAVIGGQLMALKWLGNAGSHFSGVAKSDILDAYEVMEHALHEIIDKRSHAVAKLAKKLNDKFGKP